MTTETPCETLFERLAETDPPRLVAMLGSGELRPTLLTYAAEIAGTRLQGDDVVAALLALLRHERAVVREGAIYGLAPHVDAVVAAELRRLAEYEPSPGVRTAAMGAVETAEEMGDG